MCVCVCVCIGGGGGAYARDKNTSARLCAKNAGGGGGGLMCEGGRICGTLRYIHNMLYCMVIGSTLSTSGLYKMAVSAQNSWTSTYV